MIKIILSNSKNVIWKEHEYDDYLYDGKFFVIIKDNKWIGFYNLDKVVSISVQEGK